MRPRLSLLAVCVVVVFTTSTQADFLMIPDSGNDRVGIYSAADGSLVDANFIDIAAAAASVGYAGGLTPIEALEVNGEVWVTDQVADRIWRFDTSGNFIADLAVGQIDNARGFEVVGDTVYIAQGATADQPEGIVTLDVPSLTLTGSFASAPAGDINYFDVEFYNGELFVPNIDTGNDGIERFNLAGTFLGFFAQSDGVTDFDFLQQLAPRSSNGNLLAGGFSPPSGVYEFQSDGTPLGITAGLDFGPRGVYELGNGDVLWTNGTWVRTDADIRDSGGQYRYITPTTIPEPATLLLLAMGGFAMIRRRNPQS